ncbi:MAG: diguanylate cyclase [candidate division Zixibacteria bacterium]|nr:diguanylate cyclase [candidate division Zixibacteria bacterium]
MIENILQKSTRSTTLEQGQSKSTSKTASTAKSQFHIALYQKFTAVEDRLLNSLISVEAVLHYFKNIDELYQRHCHTNLDVIVIAAGSDFEDEFKITQLIKQHPTLQLLPLILYAPEPDKDIIVKGFEYGVDEFISGFWDDDVVRAKIKMLCYRSKRDIGVNPSSGLPGAAIIEADVERRVTRREDFAVCYVDLDNFKAYNDYYGYVYGDKIIRLTATIIKDTVLDLVRDGFIGHIGGDDFVYVIPNNKIDLVCKTIINIFDKMISTRYLEDDLKRGYIEVPNRAGKLESFPIMTLSIAVIPHKQVKFKKIGEISHMMADLKKYTKGFEGSNYRIERRRKY